MRKAILGLVISSLIILPLANVLAVGTDYRYTGKPYDKNTNLYYYGQRYYDPVSGRFTQPDPVSNNLSNPQRLKQSTGQDLQKLLENPQALNSYSYTANNPVRYVDPTGEWWKEFFTGKQSLSSLSSEIGEASMYVNPVMSTAIDHPYLSGAAVGLATGLGLIAAGIVVGTAPWQLAAVESSTAAATAVAAQQTIKYGDKVVRLAGDYSTQYLSRLQSQFSQFVIKGIDIGEHALNSMNAKGYTVDQIVKVYQTGQKYLDKNVGNINIIKDGIRIAIDPNTNKFIMNVLDIPNINPARFQIIK